MKKQICVKILLYDYFPIKNCIFSLLHAEIGIENKIIYTYFNWIIEKIESIMDDELELTIF